MKNKNIVIVVAIAAAAASGAWYMNKGTEAAAGPGPKGAGGGQPPTVVNVVAPQRQDVPVVLQATGTVTPISSVDLHAQTTSILRKVHIREGQFVKAGDLMFTLDDRSERANVDKAQAQNARDRATLADLERQYKRSQELYDQKFIAKSALDTLRSQVEAARANIGAGNAALQAEQVAASYSTIRAPMSGRVGAINVFAGSLVQPVTSLTTVTQLDPITVAFTVPEASLADLLTSQHQGTVAVEAAAGANAKPVTGKLSFIDNTVDPQAGAIRVKAQFDNRDTLLWPGQFASAKVTLQTLKNAVVIPQAAIITTNRGTSVYVVDADQSARSVPVTRLYSFGLNAAVSGLNGDEQVITEGKQNLRPGGKIKLAEAPGKPHGAQKLAAKADAK
jgi:multidrug efflux system membrane fusion protein